MKLFFHIPFILFLVNFSLAKFLKEPLVTYGAIFPSEITVQTGSAFAIRLTDPFAAPQQCTYRTPKSQVNSEIGSDQRIVRWDTEPCGIFVKNVTSADIGFWRLTSSKNNDYIRGSGFIKVTLRQNDLEPDEMPDQSYCVISRPDEITFPQIKECGVPDNMPGTWKLYKGYKGQIGEVMETITHEVKVEKIFTKFERESSSRITLLCGLKNSMRHIKACRFLRVVDDFAFNVFDGFGIDRYGFHGKGLELGECGIMIDKPEAIDKGLWKCFLKGVDMEMDEKDFGGIVDSSDPPQGLKLTYPGKQVIVNGSSATLTCDANLSIDHCWFMKPGGKIWPVGENMMPPKITQSENLPDYWYHGLGFGLGECGITLREAKLSDSGQWRCSAGTSKASFEAQQFFEVDVRPTIPLLVADTSRVDVNSGEAFKIECRTVQKYLPVESCRFVTPTGAGFSLDEDVTSDLSLGAYYFDPNRKMSSGYCSLIVRRARKEHSGTWKCFAKTSTSAIEGSDTINVRVRDSITIAASIGGGITAIIFIALAVILATVIIIRRRRARANVIAVETELDSPRQSNSSRTSNEAI